MENLLHRKESLILTAIEIIDELGLQGLSTREIAKRQGMSDATLFRHFKSKSELLMAVLDYYSQYDTDIIQSTRLLNLAPKEALSYYFNAYAEYYENYPAITAIREIYDGFSSDSELKEKIRTISMERTGFIQQLISDACRDGSLDPKINCENMADIISGMLREICLKWRFSAYSFSLKERVMDSLQMILDAFIPDKS
jgi:AcrR family transcriptional regulator